MANGAAFWVAAIKIASETKKHTTVGLILVINVEIVWIRWIRFAVCKIEDCSGLYRIVSFS